MKSITMDICLIFFFFSFHVFINLFVDIKSLVWNNSNMKEKLHLKQQKEI